MYKYINEIEILNTVVFLMVPPLSVTLLYLISTLGSFCPSGHDECAIWLLRRAVLGHLSSLGATKAA